MAGEALATGGDYIVNTDNGIGTLLNAVLGKEVETETTGSQTTAGTSTQTGSTTNTGSATTSGTTQANVIGTNTGTTSGTSAQNTTGTTTGATTGTSTNTGTSNQATNSTGTTNTSGTTTGTSNLTGTSDQTTSNTGLTSNNSTSSQASGGSSSSSGSSTSNTTGSMSQTGTTKENTTGSSSTNTSGTTSNTGTAKTTGNITNNSTGVITNNSTTKTTADMTGLRDVYAEQAKGVTPEMLKAIFEEGARAAPNLIRAHANAVGARVSGNSAVASSLGDLETKLTRQIADLNRQMLNDRGVTAGKIAENTRESTTTGTQNESKTAKEIQDLLVANDSTQVMKQLADAITASSTTGSNTLTGTNQTNNTSTNQQSGSNSSFSNSAQSSTGMTSNTGTTTGTNTQAGTNTSATNSTAVQDMVSSVVGTNTNTGTTAGTTTGTQTQNATGTNTQNSSSLNTQAQTGSTTGTSTSNQTGTSTQAGTQTQQVDMSEDKSQVTQIDTGTAKNIATAAAAGIGAAALYKLATGNGFGGSVNQFVNWLKSSGTSVPPATMAELETAAQQDLAGGLDPAWGSGDDYINNIGGDGTDYNAIDLGGDMAGDAGDFIDYGDFLADGGQVKGYADGGQPDLDFIDVPNLLGKKTPVVVNGDSDISNILNSINQSSSGAATSAASAAVNGTGAGAGTDQGGGGPGGTAGGTSSGTAPPGGLTMGNVANMAALAMSIASGNILGVVTNGAKLISSMSGKTPPSNTSGGPGTTSSSPTGSVTVGSIGISSNPSQDAMDAASVAADDANEGIADNSGIGPDGSGIGGDDGDGGVGVGGPGAGTSGGASGTGDYADGGQVDDEICSVPKSTLMEAMGIASDGKGGMSFNSHAVSLMRKSMSKSSKPPGFADGKKPGLIKGPGTGISDSIPAVGPNNRPIRVSNNEYILPADTVAAIGVDKLDQIVAETHIPADLQRAMIGA